MLARFQEAYYKGFHMGESAAAVPRVDTSGASFPVGGMHLCATHPAVGTVLRPVIWAAQHGGAQGEHAVGAIVPCNGAPLVSCPAMLDSLWEQGAQ